MALLDFEVIGLIEEEDDDAPQEILCSHLEVEIFFFLQDQIISNLWKYVLALFATSAVTFWESLNLVPNHHHHIVDWRRSL